MTLPLASSCLFDAHKVLLMFQLISPSHRENVHERFSITPSNKSIAAVALLFFSARHSLSPAVSYRQSRSSSHQPKPNFNINFCRSIASYRPVDHGKLQRSSKSKEKWEKSEQGLNFSNATATIV